MEPHPNLLSLDDLTDGQLEHMFELAERLQADPTLGRDALAGITVGLLFFRGSLRTRSSFEAAVAQLGGHPINLTAHTDFWELEYREGRVMDGRAPEHVRDAARVLSSYVDLLAVRPAPEQRKWAVDRADQQIGAWAKFANVPVVNMESGLWHPLQALADLFTLRRALGRQTSGSSGPRRRICLAWTHSPTPAPVSAAHSLLVAACRAGYEVRLAHPPGFDLDEQVVAQARAAAGASGGELVHATDLHDGIDGVDVVYARSWESLETYGDPTLSASRRAKAGDWRIDERLMARGNDARLMHAMPVRRNVEVTDEVIDGPRSLLFEQAANRLPCQKALLLDLLGRGADL
ncbi:Ornithine carbamoyltransferase [Planctomycetes bacterium Pla163]|uniref:Ornithine carbamoyltransferase n=1 Tax=Rohdeia mirabilis TaxID=2528008 RepID=A0A518D2Q6_9BACT|nr:Ornithine carbamoyltransferase [Planctomycetes bacterium Pla163]